MEPRKVKIKVSSTATDALIGNEGSNGTSITPRFARRGDKTSRLLQVRRIERNSGSANLGAPEKLAFGAFERITPKYTLIKELEWKTAQPVYVRHFAFACALGVIFLMIIGFKIKTSVFKVPKPSKGELQANHQVEQVLSKSGGVSLPVSIDPGPPREIKPVRHRNPSEAK